MNIYHRNVEEGHIPQIHNKDKLKLVGRGAVTEITMDGKTFQVYDAQKIHSLITFVERHEDRLFELNQENKALKKQLNLLTKNLNDLNSTVKKLQDQLKNAGFNTNYL